MEKEQNPSGDLAKDITTLFREGPYAGKNGNAFKELYGSQRLVDGSKLVATVQAPSSTNQAATLSHLGFVAHRDYDIKIDLGAHTSCISKS